MMCAKDKMETMVPSAKEEEREEEEMEEEETEEEEGDDEEGDDVDEDGTEKDGDEGGSEKNKDDKEVEETLPQARKKKKPLPVKAKKKTQDGVLNLNNEVVRMRKEVKRVRALIIRKLTRQIAALKKKKGKEAEIERNQRRAAKLLEEIHVMKKLVPDLVTKTALQKNLNFEQVCKNPKSTISDRAITRIATHPQFNKKIESIKAAVKAFKEERMKGGKQVRADKEQNQAGKADQWSPDKRVERKSEEKEEDNAVEVKEILDGEEGAVPLENTEDSIVVKVENEVEKDTCSAGPAKVQMQEITVKSSNVKNNVNNKPAKKEPSLPLPPAVPQKRSDEDESDLELSDDEEKQYFDDSTEERFHKQSSQSEESDDDDDFFVGKVSKFKKKKKKQKDMDGEERQEVEKDSTNSVKTSDKLQSELDELESRLKSKATKLQSVFCSSLAATKAGRGGRGRGGDKFRGQGKPKGGSGLNRDFSKESNFPKQSKGVERNAGSKYSKPCPEGRLSESEQKGFTSPGRGRGRGRGQGRGDALRQNNHRGGGAFSHPAPQQALHPSWEASKKRKEQQGQILAFQGKKIKFDDD